MEAPLARKELLYDAALAFTWFVLAKICDWLLEGFALNTFGPRTGAMVHAAIFGALLLAFVARGIWRLRDRFSVLVGAAVLLIPVGAYLLTAW